MRVLITSARAPHALTLIRGLGQRGWEVTAADTTRLSPGLYSRYAAHRLHMPSLTARPLDWARCLLKELERVPYDLLLPTFEDSFMVARLSDRLPKSLRVVGDSFRNQMRLHHKPRLVELAREVGCAVPDTWQPEDAESLRGIAADLPYPVVVKPPAANNSLGLAVAADPAGLHAAWRGLIRAHGLRHGGMPMVQRRVEGRHVSTLLFARDGLTLAQVCYEPVLMFPDDGGTAFWRRAIEHRQIEGLSETVARHLNWNGFLGLDFIVDKTTSRPLLLDANPRPTPALGLGEQAGVPFVELVDEFGRGQPAVKRPPAETGAETRTGFVFLLWCAFMLMPGRGFFARLARVRETWRRPNPRPDFHDPEDRRPSWWLRAYVPYFMLVLETAAGKRGGFMAGSTYDGRTDESVRSGLTGLLEKG